MQDTNFKDVKYPLCINFETFKQYNNEVTNWNEIIFFEWLIVKNLSFGKKKFFYQNERVYEELIIKRTTLNKVKQTFSTLGLEYDTSGKNNTTEYKVSDSFIKEFVETRINKPYQKTTLKKLLELDFKFNITFTKSDRKRIEDIIKQLDIIYNARRSDQINQTNGRTILDQTNLPYNDETIKRFKLLMDKYSEKAIQNAFLVHVDNLINGKDKNVHILNNFCSYKRDKNSFPIFESRLEFYNNNYEQRL